jgi:hypothetical protein
MSADGAQAAGGAVDGGPSVDRSQVRSLRRAEGLPAPYRPDPQPATSTPAPTPVAASLAPTVAVANPEPAAAARPLNQPVAAAYSTGTVRLDALRQLLDDPREVTRLYKERHETAGFKADTFTLPVDLYQTLTRVAKERRVTKKWLVAATLEALLEAWGEPVGPAE